VESRVGMLTGESIAKRILTGKDEIDLTKAGITCFSMVVAKGGTTTLAFRDGMGLIGWYQAMVETPFKY